MKLTAALTIALPFFMANQVLAICAGSTFGIGGAIDLGGAGVHRWNVYDNNCNVVDGLTTAGNPCDSGVFGCSPPPIFFDKYKNHLTGITYGCQRDASSEQCGNDVISVCCR